MVLLKLCRRPLTFEEASEERRGGRQSGEEVVGKNIEEASMGLSVNQGDRRTHSLAAPLSPARAPTDDFAVCVSTDGKPCDIIVLCSSGRCGGSLRTETQSAWIFPPPFIPVSISYSPVLQFITQVVSSRYIAYDIIRRRHYSSVTEWFCVCFISSLR
ncbi:hypothetical protein PAMA_007998 [Pampus argenteus]